ncbi:hypothetical protein [Amycolatopsis sp. WGS_07]|uniref:hypothetical protein n=1 Tax=Amycolatopsis sp. WGS_07 TaxID=3076764 RepID=UPI00387352EF
MVTFDRQATRDRLAGLDPARLVAFAASCVQRRESAVDTLARHGRAEDQAVFQAALAETWAAALSGAPSEGDQLDGFAELNAEEEPSGALAFTADAIQALWYALKFRATGDREWVFHCASRCYDSAGFADVVSGGGFGFGAAEVRLQLEDLSELETSRLGPELIARLVARSSRESERIRPHVTESGSG